jgi:hypothetical protein
MSGRSSVSSRRGPVSRRASESYPFNDYDGASLLWCLAIGSALNGGAIRIGLTRDGGALAIGVYQGENYGTEYVRPDEDLDTVVREIAAGWGIPIAIWDDVANRFRLP